MSETTARILAIDTATGPCSVAVWDGGRITAFAENSRPVMQSASLMPMVEDALKQSGLSYHDLTSVACTTGPGGFTGIRVGLAAASGIALSAKIKGIGFTTLEVMAFGARKLVSKNITCIFASIGAGKGEWYYQCFATAPYWQPVFAPRVGSWEQAMKSAVPVPVVMVGNATVSAKGFTHCGIQTPRADILAELAAQPVAANQTAFLPQELRPFYIRPPDAKLPAKNF